MKSPEMITLCILYNSFNDHFIPHTKCCERIFLFCYTYEVTVQCGSPEFSAIQVVATICRMCLHISVVYIRICLCLILGNSVDIANNQTQTLSAYVHEKACKTLIQTMDAEQFFSIQKSCS